MSVADKIGGFAWLLKIYDLDPNLAFLATLVADFGIIFFLMFLEGLAPNGIMPWRRQHYKTFAWNDTVFIPMYVMAAAIILQGAPKIDGFYATRGWHWFVLILGFAVSIFLEYGALKSGQYTWSQELSPSKLWHTFIFGVMFYWLVSTLLPVIAVHRPTSAMLFVIMALIGFVRNCYRDATLPQPWNAHLEGAYVPWEWHERKR